MLATQTPLIGAEVAVAHLLQYAEPAILSPQVSQPFLPAAHSATHLPSVVLPVAYSRIFPGGQEEHLLEPAAVHVAQLASHATGLPLPSM